MAQPLSMASSAGATAAGMAAGVVGEGLSNVAQNTMYSGAPSPLGFGWDVAAGIAKAYPTYAAGTGELHGIWMEVQCQECKCWEGDYVITYKWQNTTSKTVPCDLTKTSWGKTNPNSMGAAGAAFGPTKHVLVLGYLTPLEMGQIRDQCAEQADEHCP